MAKVGLSVGAPLVAAAVWGAFASTRAPVQLPVLLSLILQALVFRSAASGLLVIGHRTVAAMFLMIVVINALLMHAWQQ